MERIVKEEGMEIWKYNPSILQPFYVNMEPLTLMRRFRFLMDYVYGYTVYYLKVEGKMVGYCTITSGKNPRFWFAKREDIIVGPYYIAPTVRGQGLSTKLVQQVLHGCGIQWEAAYLYILHTNTPSIGTAKKNGAKRICNVHNTLFRKLIQTESGEYGVYQIQRGAAWRK